MHLPHRAVLPGFGLSLGISVFGLSLLVILPFAMLVFTTASMGWDAFIQTISHERVLAAVWLSLRLSFYATLTNLVFGLIVAWVLVRYQFVGKGVINALVDLPFALPTAVTGIALATLYAPNGWLGRFFAEGSLWASVFGPLPIAFKPLGIWLALVVVSLPFIVRAVQPVLENLQPAMEEASATLGASRWTTMWRVILPELYPALLAGSGMMFARATGEYGSVIFIAGNIPMESEILPLIITSKLEQFDVQGAAAVALFMLLIAFAILVVLNTLQWRLSRHRKGRS